MPFPPLRFRNRTLWLLDQRRLPEKEVWIACKSSRKVHWAIRNMVVRGAPAIGIAAGYGLYLGIRNFEGSPEKFLKKLKEEAEFLKSARPTGVNLRNVIDRIIAVVERQPPHPTLSKGVRRFSAKKRLTPLKALVLAEARRARREDDRRCRRIGRFGQALIQSGDRVLTHCNAGGLATSGFGTALGVLYAAKAKGKKIFVYAGETRPLLQGARLTAWELTQSRIPCTLLCDSSAASLMKAGKIDRIVVGADRIAASGDTANKIGTYNLAVLARAHGVPFYVAAPSTTFDFTIRSGKEIPIEHRDGREITDAFRAGATRRVAPPKVNAYNPAFDVTPHGLITAFITEVGVLRPPFAKSFQRLKVPGSFRFLEPQA